MEAVKTLGARTQQVEENVVIEGAQGKVADSGTIDCGNSGTTMRLMMGILAGCSGNYLLDGDQSLRRRPMERVASPLRKMGANIICNEGKCPIRIGPARLSGMDYVTPTPSAQLKSAILLAGLQADGQTCVTEPSPSRDHTERLIRSWGGSIENHAMRVVVRRSSLLMPKFLKAPGDPSSAAFFLCGAAIVPGSELIVENLLLNEGRLGFLRVLQRMNAKVRVEIQGNDPEPWGLTKVSYKNGLKACVVHEKEIPTLVDEVPILALVATQAQGWTEFRGVGELRVKESDRLEAIMETLSNMGAVAHVERDTLRVHGPARLKPTARARSFGDHRIAMMLRIASQLTDDNLEMDDEDCIRISYPEFQDHFLQLVT
jgi:3-phosphoshikimate 1-carboxyvinyltransferase